MKKIGLLLFFAVFACSLSAQNRLSVFIGNANRYASVDLSDFCRRLCVEYDDYYRRYKSEGWGRILIELGIGPESSYCAPFYDRVHCHSDYWHEHYDSYCKRHGKYHPHKHGYKKHPKYGKRKYGRYHDDDYDDDEDDDD